MGIVAPERIKRFFLGFATSSEKHYLEISIRLLIGAAFVISAPHARASLVFTIFGWVLLVTSVALLFLPWGWHHRFAQRSVPTAMRFLPVVAILSLVGGGFLLWALN
jgi:hypothetical protein